MTEEVMQGIDDIEVAVGPMVQVVPPETGAPVRHFPWSDIAQEGDDPATISDQDIIDRVARWMDRDPSDFDGYKVSRPETGNILVSMPGTYGRERKPGLLQAIASRVGIDSGPNTYYLNMPIQKEKFRYNRGVRIRRAPPFPQHVERSLGSLTWDALPYVFMARVPWLPFPGFMFRAVSLAVVLSALVIVLGKTGGV